MFRQIVAVFTLSTGIYSLCRALFLSTFNVLRSSICTVCTGIVFSVCLLLWLQVTEHVLCNVYNYYDNLWKLSCV